MNKGSGSGSGIFPDPDPDPGDQKRPDPQHCFKESVARGTKINYFSIYFSIHAVEISYFADIVINVKTS